MQHIPTLKQAVAAIIKSIHLKVIAGALAMVVPQLAAAACNTYSCRAPITSLYINGSFVWVELAISDSDRSTINCALAEGIYFSLPETNPRFREIYAALVSAQARGTDVKLRVITGSPNCEVVYLMAYN